MKRVEARQTSAAHGETLAGKIEMEADVFQKIQSQQATDWTLWRQIVANDVESRKPHTKGLDRLDPDQRFVFNTSDCDELDMPQRLGWIIADRQQGSDRSDGVGRTGIQRHADKLAALRAF